MNLSVSGKWTHPKAIVLTYRSLEGVRERVWHDCLWVQDSIKAVLGSLFGWVWYTLSGIVSLTGCLSITIYLAQCFLFIGWALTSFISPAYRLLGGDMRTLSWKYTWLVQPCCKEALACYLILLLGLVQWLNLHLGSIGIHYGHICMSQLLHVPSCSLHVARESNSGWPNVLGPCTLVADLEEAPFSWLLIISVPVIVTPWEVNKQMDDLFLCTSFSL